SSEFFRKDYAALIDHIETEIAAILRRRAATSRHSLHSVFTAKTEVSFRVALDGVVERVQSHLKPDLWRGGEENEHASREAAQESKSRKQQWQEPPPHPSTEVIPAGDPHGTGPEPTPLEE